MKIERQRMGFDLVEGPPVDYVARECPDPTREAYGQSFSGVDLSSQIGELRFKHTFNSRWQVVAGGLDQLANRNINTTVNSLIDNKRDYRTYFANALQPTLADFHVELSGLSKRTERRRQG